MDVDGQLADQRAEKEGIICHVQRAFTECCAGYACVIRLMPAYILLVLKDLKATSFKNGPCKHAFTALISAVQLEIDLLLYVSAVLPAAAIEEARAVTPT